MDTLTGYCASIFRVLGQPTRIEIVESLRIGELCVADIILIIKQEQSNTSRHLSVMYSNGILANRRVGHRTLYSLKHKELILALLDSAKHSFFKDYADALKMLGQQTRMRIAEILTEGEVALAELIRRVGGEQTNTAHHLAVMLEAGIVLTRMDARRRAFYKLTNQDYVLHLVESATQIMAQETLNRQRVLH